MGNQLTKAELDTLFADNTIRSISPAKLRDLVESACVPHGALHYTDGGGATTISTPSTYTKIANTASLDMGSAFSMSAVGRLRYDGTKTVHALLTAALSITCAANNQTLGFAMYKNGSIITPSIMRTKISTGADVQSLSMHVATDLAPGDYIEIYVANETSASNVTVNHGYISALGILH